MRYPTDEESRGDDEDDAAGTADETLTGQTDGTNLTADMDARSSKLILGSYTLDDVH